MRKKSRRRIDKGRCRSPLNKDVDDALAALPGASLPPHFCEPLPTGPDDAASIVRRLIELIPSDVGHHGFPSHAEFDEMGDEYKEWLDGIAHPSRHSGQ